MYVGTSVRRMGAVRPTGKGRGMLVALRRIGRLLTGGRLKGVGRFEGTSFPCTRGVVLMGAASGGILVSLAGGRVV